MFHRVFLLLATMFACQSADVRADEGPAKEVPELQALSNYIGTWDIAITSKDSPFTKGESTATWILEGRFLQRTGVLKSDDGTAILKITTLMTYDTNTKSYRMWSFLSHGSTSEASEKWDAGNHTMTSISRQDGTTTTTTAKFTERNIEEWMFVTPNQNNEVVGKFGGTNTCHKQ